MSYHTYALLSENPDFTRRTRSCIFQQANYWFNDTRPDMIALSRDLLKFAPTQTQSMIQGICAGPGFDTLVDNGDGTIDQSKVTDEDLLAQCQAIYPTVASLYYDSTGAIIPPN